MTRYLYLLLGALAAFAASLFGTFHFDDYSLLSNPLVTQTSGLWRIWSPLQTRPLTYFSFWLNYRLGGANPAGYHAVNLLLHCAAVLLLYHVLLKIVHARVAFLAAALFAIHPIQSEAVAYVFARGTLLCTVFCLASLNEWLRGRRWMAVTLFGAALLAKEECVTFPVFLLLLLFSWKRIERSDWKAAAAMLALAAAAGLRAAIATKYTEGSGAGFTAGIGPFPYLAAQGLSILRYLRLLIVPWGFTVDPSVPNHSAWLAALAWLAVVAVVALAAFRFKRVKEGFWVIAGLVLLIPSSSIFPAADLAVDHRMYLPMMAFATAIALVVRKWRIWILAGVGLALLALSFLRMEVWRTEPSLWREAVYRSPGKLRPLIQLARFSPTGQALDLLIEAKQIAPNSPEIASQLGVLWLQMGEKQLALQEFGRALALTPHSANAIANRGAALLSLGQNEAAIRDFETALRIDPCAKAARINLEALHRPLPACATEK